MPLVVTPNPNVQPISSRGGRREGRRQWHVRNDDDSIVTHDQIYAEFGFQLPVGGDAHPNDPDLFAIDYEINPVEDHASKLFTFDLIYRDGESPGIPPETIGYVEFDGDFTAISEEVWRTGATLPSQGNVANNNTTDIGGTHADIRGFPVSAPRRRVVLIVREVLAISTYESRINTYSAAAWTRNNATFEGAGAGEVLYLGAQASRIDLGKVSVSHRFVRDFEFHLVQIPLRDEVGDVVIGSDDLTADAVYFRQPFTTQANFGALSDNF